MATLYLFRVRLERKRQTEAFFQRDISRSEALRLAFEEEVPTYEDGWGRVWRPGDMERLDEGGLYFVFGRETTETEREWVDSVEGYRESEHVHAETVPVFFELESQLIAIGYRRELGRTPQTVANRLRDVLRSAESIRQSEYEVSEISQIPDPSSFIRHVRDAYAVKTFTFWFSRPNFADERDLTRKLGAFTEDIGAEGGRTVVSGDDLDRDVAEDMTSAAVSEGQDVSAQLQRSEGADVETIHAKDNNPKSLEAGDLGSTQQRRSLMERMRAAFDELRG